MKNIPQINIHANFRPELDFSHKKSLSQNHRELEIEVPLQISYVFPLTI